MARKRFKPSAEAICSVVAGDDSRGRIHSTDIAHRGGRGMLQWLKRHGHIEKYSSGRGGDFYYFTRSGKKMGDKACDLQYGSPGKKYRARRAK